MAYRDIVLADSPRNFFEFTGDSLLSSVGGYQIYNDTALTFVNTTHGRGIQFNGSTSTASTDGIGGTGGGTFNNFSVEAVIKTTTTAYSRIWDFGATNTSSRGIMAVTAAGKLQGHSGGSTYVLSTTSINDGNWHHVAVSATTGTVKVYVDGVLEGTSTTGAGSNSNFASDSFLGGVNTAQPFAGTVDNLAFYPAGKADSVWAAHATAWAAGDNASIEVTLPTTTISLQAPDVTFQYNKSQTVDVVSANVSANAYDPTVDTQQITIEALSPTEDFSVTSAGVITDDNVVRADGSPLEAGIFKFDIPQGVDIISAVFKYNTVGKSLSNSVEPDVYLGVVETWDTTNYYNTAVTGEVAVTTALGAKTTNLTSLITPSTFKGLKFYRKTGASSMDLASKENATVANRPTLEVSYVPSPGVTVDVPTTSMSLQAQDVIATTQRSTEFIASTQTLSVAAVEATVDAGAGHNADTATVVLSVQDVTVETIVSPDVTVEFDTANAVVQAPEANTGAGTTVDADNTDTVMLGAYDVTVEFTQSAISEFDTPLLEVKHVRLQDVNGEPVLAAETDDPYFISTMDTLVGLQRGFSGGLNGTDKDSAISPDRQIWFRMNETSGTVATDRLYISPGDPSGTKAQLNLNNVVVGLHDGPEGRHHWYFNGDAYAVETDATGPAGEREQGLEFTFRTEKRNQFIMGNADYSGKLFTTAPVIWELWMVEGRLEVRTGRQSLNERREIITTWTVHTAFDDLADGNWHHVVLQSGYKSWAAPVGSGQGWGLELYVDAKLALRRRDPAIATYGFPDFIGGRPSPLYPNENFNSSVVAPDLARSAWFVGDMTELVWRQGRALTDDEAARQRDTMMGVFPYYANGPKIALKANEATVKGNKPRILVLNFDAGTTLASRAVNFTPEAQVALTASLKPTLEAWATPGAGRTSIVFQGLGEASLGETDRLYTQTDKMEEWTDSGYLRFEHHVTFAGTRSNPKNYRDAITDNYRLIDLDVDLNMDDFDIISIVAYPGNATQMAQYDAFDAVNAAPYVPGRVMLENLMVQVKDQVVNNGKSLFIADPFSATALGIIDQVDVVPEFYEQTPKNLFDERLGAVNPGIDAHAYATDPFGGSEPASTSVGTGTPGDPFKIPHTNYLEYANRAKTSGARIKAASRYEDTHGNVRQRVRHVVQGLTTIGGYVQTDEIQWWNVNPVNEPPYALSRQYADKRAGLSIGDEFYIDAPKWSEIYHRTGFFDEQNWKHGGYRVAAPISSIKVGKAVTSFTQYMYAGTREAENLYNTVDVVDEDGNVLPNVEVVGNPYYDHAISIAVEPGDSWNGETVQGKVYVNFTESMQFRAHIPLIEKQMAWEDNFPNAEFPFEYPDKRSLAIGETVGASVWRITPEMRKYQWSTHYGTTTGTEINFPSRAKPDWGWSAGGVRGSGLSGGGGEAINWFWNAAADELDIPVPTMSERALKWLSTDLDLDGSADVTVQTVEVAVAANDVTVEVSSNAVVDVATARLTVENYNDADTVSPDVNVLVPTPAVNLRANGIAMDVTLDTPTVTLSTTDPLNEPVEIDWSEVIVLTLPRQIITLTLEDN